MQSKSTKLNLKLLPQPDTNSGLGNKVSFIWSEKEAHEHHSTVCKERVIISNLERENITVLLQKEIRFFGIDNNGYKFK